MLEWRHASLLATQLYEYQSSISCPTRIYLLEGSAGSVFDLKRTPFCHAVSRLQLTILSLHLTELNGPRAFGF